MEYEGERINWQLNLSVVSQCWNLEEQYLVKYYAT